MQLLIFGGVPGESEGCPYVFVRQEGSTLQAGQKVRESVSLSFVTR